MRGEKRGVVFAVDKKTLDFGSPIINCRTPGIVKDTFRLTFAGDSSAKAYIEKVFPLNSNYFSHNLNDAQTLKDVNYFVVELRETKPGVYEDSLRFLLKPCEVLKTIVLRAERSDLKLLTLDSLNFGGAVVGTKRDSFVYIFNATPAPVEISEAALNGKDFALKSIDFPITIEPDSSFRFDISFSPAEVKRSEGALTIFADRPCSAQRTIFIEGEGLNKPEIRVAASVPKNLWAKPGEEFYIPVEIRSDEDREISEAKIDSFAFEIEYDPTLIYPLGTTLGAAAAVRGFNVRAEEIAPGEYSVFYSFDEAAEFREGEIFKIKALALLGDSLTTEIRIKRADFFSEPLLTVRRENGSFSIAGECDLKNRLISFDGGVALKLEFEQATGKVFATIESKTRTKVLAEIYDYLGSKAATLGEKRLRPGEKIRFPICLSSLSRGAYFVVVRTHKVLISKPIIAK